MGNREFCYQVERLRRVCVASADMDDDGPQDGGWSDADADLQVNPEVHPR